MAEYPVGLGVIGWDLEELEKELDSLIESDDSIYEEVKAIEITPKSSFVVPPIAFASIFLAFTSIGPLLCSGLFRYVYVTKGVVLLASSIVKIAYLFPARASENDGRLDSLGTEQTPNRQIHLPEAAVRTRQQTFQVLASALGSLDEILSLFLIYELYLCTCHMAARNQSPLRFAKMIAATSTFALFSHGPGILFALIADPWCFFIMIILEPIPFLINASCAGSILYFGARVLNALRKSDEFRNSISQRGKATGNNFHLTLIVITVIAAQVLKFLSRMAGLIAMPIFLSKESECNAEFGAADDDIKDMERCEEYNNTLSFMLAYWNNPYGAALEILCVYILLVLKQSFDNRCVLACTCTP